MEKRPGKSPAFAGLAVVLAIITLTGCSTARAPTDALTRADLRIRLAREAGADEASSLDLRRAAEKIEKARGAMSAGRQDEARRLAESAQVDAELAEVKAEAEVLRRAADHLRRRVDAEQSDAERESRKPLSRLPGQ
jgi:hypothetical protein